MSRIACDLDGVLVDFDLYIKENLSKQARHDDAQMWKELQTKPRFYRKMKPTPYARKLWQAIMATGLDRYILTAIPRVTSIPTAEEDKRQWCDVIHANDVFNNDAPEVKIGPYSRDKQKHCRPGDILIDDKRSNCEEWEAAGGVAILHRGDVDATIRALNAAVYGVLDDAD